MKGEQRNHLSLFDIFGEYDVSIGLAERIQKAWKKSFSDLTDEELTALLRQRFAVEYILPLARQRVIEDGDEELKEILERIDLENNL